MKIINKLSLTLLIILLISGCSKKEEETFHNLDLAGEWNFATDTADIGISQQWYRKEFRETIQLPGSMKENGKGFEPTLQTEWTGSIYDSSWFFNPRMKEYRQPGDLKFPFWLTPVKYYKGPAWYQKKVKIPDSWEDHRIVLLLERLDKASG